MWQPRSSLAPSVSSSMASAIVSAVLRCWESCRLSFALAGLGGTGEQGIIGRFAAFFSGLNNISLEVAEEDFCAAAPSGVSRISGVRSGCPRK